MHVAVWKFVPREVSREVLVRSAVGQYQWARAGAGTVVGCGLPGSGIMMLRVRQSSRKLSSLLVALGWRRVGHGGYMADGQAGLPRSRGGMCARSPDM